MLIYLVDQIALKFSMAVFFLRIVQSKWQRIIIYVSMGIYATYSFAFIAVATFQCGVPKVVNFITGENCMPWDTVTGPMNCKSTCRMMTPAVELILPFPYTDVAGVFNAVIDWIFIITPIIVVSKTMMTTRAKVSVCSIILLGALGSVASIARIPLLKDIKTTPSLSYFKNLIPIALVSITESGIGIMAISLAAIRPLLSQCIDRTRGSSARGYTTSGGKANTNALARTDTRGTNRLPEDDLDSNIKIPLVEITPYSLRAIATSSSRKSSTEPELLETV